MYFGRYKHLLTGSLIITLLVTPSFIYYEQIITPLLIMANGPEMLKLASLTLFLALILSTMSCWLVKTIVEHFDAKVRKTYHVVVWLIGVPFHLKFLNFLHRTLWGESFTIGVYKILNYFFVLNTLACFVIILILALIWLWKYFFKK